ncbi:hypothetical protein [Alicyclobacillus acidoterrestris]|uniref:Uncharacterized protein n=1 Tax=Alicyclobacillus acidoterrestris (strain ATCC 49025 / DSM 3922 / CIP 106132 / NCIMB 13137 / GD3B) TaxID=1356854 RepID=T0CP14_ALIAG|nr:hypothetical protein [Alicyclobacillus acidoterrestris]EPZ41212.1 hypothetical protein N007_17270 [Alicyclobacillus acidoterrestris ATCC 49025]UNO48085.1 hypothetical protein K1I37_15550 [Alicyclobacillus acidoterrestris]
MKIYENQYHYGWEGDNGIGERLIQQIIDGTKTATCAPKISYTAEELEKTYALVGTVCTVTDKFGTPRCNVRHVEVFETTFGNPDPRLVHGEGAGEDVKKFQRDHMNAWNGMAAEGVPLTHDTVLIAELFELIKD